HAPGHPGRAGTTRTNTYWQTGRTIHNQLPHNQPARDEAARNQPAHNQPAHNQPAHNQPAHHQPAHNEAPHDRPRPPTPTLTGTQRSRP
ncbi:hypothetical protein ACIQCY_05040, partial [Arthrobacter sp. NPDC092385]